MQHVFVIVYMCTSSLCLFSHELSVWFDAFYFHFYHNEKVCVCACVCVCRYHEYSSKASVLEAAQNSSPCGRVGSWKRCCNSTDSVPYLYDINVFCPSPFPPLNFIFMANYSGMCV